MKNIEILLLSAVIAMPVCAGAQNTRKTSPGVGSVSSEGGAPAARRQPRNKKLDAKVPPPAKGGTEDFAARGPSDDLYEAGANPDENLIIRARVGAAFSGLSGLRSALTLYWGDNEMAFPPDLQALVPQYTERIFAINIPGCAKTNKVTLVKNLKGADLGKVIRNTGGWLYIADPKSKRWGDLVIDSSRIYKGKPLYEY